MLRFFSYGQIWYKSIWDLAMEWLLFNKIYHTLFHSAQLKFFDISNFFPVPYISTYANSTEFC